MEKVRYGIVGLGNMGTGHSTNLIKGLDENAVLAACCDIDPKKIEALKAKLSEIDAEAEAKIKYFDDAETMFKSGEIDLAVIAIPHYDHPKYSIMALNYGLNVICEKPAGVYTKQVKEMNEVAEKSGKIFAVMFNQRTNPVFKKMRDMVQEGAVGEIKRTNWIITDWYRPQSYYDSGSWRATWKGEGGGVLFNQAPHNIDLFQWITGMMPTSVRSHCHFGKWHDIEVEDDVTAYFEYANGATGVFITTTGDAPGSNRFEIVGTKGTLIYDHNKLRYGKLEKDEREFNATYKGGFGCPKTEWTDIEVESHPDPQHIYVMRNVSKAILGLEPLYIDGKEGIKGVQLADAMLLSTWLDKKVEIPFDDDLYYAELQKRVATGVDKQVEAKTLDTAGTYNN